MSNANAASVTYSVTKNFEKRTSKQTNRQTKSQTDMLDKNSLVTRTGNYNYSY